MRQPPRDVLDEDVLAIVRATWEPDAVRAEHLPLGFGAHHWRISAASGPALFATLDSLDADRGLADLAATYRAAAVLAERLPFLHAGLAPWAVPVPRAGGAASALSATPWIDGTPPETLDRDATAGLLAALHAAEPPEGLLRWTPVVDARFPAALAASVGEPWRSGPHGEEARSAISAHLAELRAWTDAYLRIADLADGREWVPTHGEAGIHNQLVVDGRIVLVDTESLRLAPPERDTRTLDAGDADMLAMFDLEWRLDEIAQYADWFRSPHGDGEGDRIALEGLIEELERA